MQGLVRKKNIWVVLILQEWIFRVGVDEEGAILEWLEIKGDEDVVVKLNHRKLEKLNLIIGPRWSFSIDKGMVIVEAFKTVFMITKTAQMITKTAQMITKTAQIVEHGSTPAFQRAAWQSSPSLHQSSVDQVSDSP